MKGKNVFQSLVITTIIIMITKTYCGEYSYIVLSKIRTVYSNYVLFLNVLLF